jgi:hypothetical protein
MNVQMLYFLSGALARIYHQPVSRPAGALFFGDFPRRVKELGQYTGIFGPNVGQPPRMLFGNNKSVKRGLRIYVPKRANVPAFINHIGFNLALRYFTKQAIFAHNKASYVV